MKLEDLFAHSDEKHTGMDDVALLRVGDTSVSATTSRWCSGATSSRTRASPDLENGSRWLVVPNGFNGPSALVCGPRGEAELEVALRLIVDYTREPRPDYEVRWKSEDGPCARSLAAVILEGPSA